MRLSESEWKALRARIEEQEKMIKELRENFGNLKSESASFEAYLKSVGIAVKPLGKHLTYEQYLKEVSS